MFFEIRFSSNTYLIVGMRWIYFLTSIVSIIFFVHKINGHFGVYS